MGKINWCCLQNKGIKLVEPNIKIAKDYINEAQDDLKEMQNANSLKWKEIQAYYTCYNSVYAIFQKIGIKCEIHSCTLDLLEYLSDKLEICNKDIEFLRDLKDRRIDVQYYLKDPKPIKEIDVTSFALLCNKIFNQLNFDDISEIRSKVDELIENASENEKRK
jgi:uncharacterized protein (UPF0332 family)